jgi:Acetyl/propionyl-CoA carboxylase, alpha subunit
MKFLTELQGEKFEVELRVEGEKVFAKVADREYELESSEVESGVYLFKHDNRVYQIYIDSEGNAKVNNHFFEIKVFDPKRLRGFDKSGFSAEGTVEIKTAMPGKVVRVLVKEGDQVKSGDGVIVVEAMKMQNEMKSPKDGIVKEIRFSEGETVNAGEVLVVVE